MAQGGSQVVQVVAGAHEHPHPMSSRESLQFRLPLALHPNSCENVSKWFRLRKTGFHILTPGFTGMHT